MQRLARVQRHIATTTAAANVDKNVQQQQAALQTLLDAARRDGALTWREAFASSALGQSTTPPNGPLSAYQYEAWWREGYVVVPLPSDIDMDALRREVEDLVELNATRLVAAGRLSQEDYETTLGAPLDTANTD